MDRETVCELDPLAEVKEPVIEQVLDGVVDVEVPELFPPPLLVDVVVPVFVDVPLLVVEVEVVEVVVPSGQDPHTGFLALVSGAFNEKSAGSVGILSTHQPDKS